MEEGREEAAAAEEVLYEIRQHAERPFSSDSFREEVGRSSAGGWRSYLSFQGAKQLKEKWTRYKRPRLFTKRTSLFVSPNGEYIAIACRNQITILQKGDNYMHPTGIFTSNDRLTAFAGGAWLESQGILGVIDEMSTLFLIKSSGEELVRRSSSQLKLSAPIIDLIVQDDVRSGFYIFTEDALLHHVDIFLDPTACIYQVPTSSRFLTDKKQFPHKVFCLDFHSSLSFGVLVGASSVSENSSDDSGFYFVFLFRLTTNLELELLFCSPQFKGLFVASNSDNGPFTSPKVAISPHAKHVAVLNLSGGIDLFNLDAEKFSLSNISFAETQHSNIADSLTHTSKESIQSIVDISWWTDHILILAKREGNISIYNIISGVKVIENDPVFSMPAIERMKHHEGHVFVLESSKLSDENISLSEPAKSKNMQQTKPMSSITANQLDNDKFYWRLMSLSGKSVSEMYTVLISNQQYQCALEFASRHKLDKNEVFKEQWLHSDQGIHDIDVILPKITDQMFVLSECLDKVGPSEDIVKALLSYGLRITDEYKFLDLDDGQSNTVWDFWVIRLQLLQYRDKLETFMGINMGRFSMQEYRKFRAIPLYEAAISLAESGKIGALNLLFKRHPYSLSPKILDILSAIPETVPVQSYGQLLPGRSPPSTIALRESDWVECEKMISFINNMPSNSEKCIQLRTENILKQSLGFVWPSTAELSEWYIKRTRDIDNLSGQLDNCLSLLEFAYCKGMVELQNFLEDTSYLHQLIYSDSCEEDFSMSLIAWEQLSDYEKFRIMLKGVKEDTVVKRLNDTAVPFMKQRCFFKPVDSRDKMEENQGFPHQDEKDSFVVRWLKEIAADNLLEICLAVIENGCGDFPVDGLFKNEVEIVETALHCIYLCTLIDQWNTMASILSKLPRKTLRHNSSKEFNTRHGTQSLGTPRFSYLRSQLGRSEMQLSSTNSLEGERASQNSRGSVDHLDSDASDDIERRINIAEGHVEVGRLLAFYQVPKPISFFLGAQSDEKNVKQLLRLILSKFGRRQPGRSDNDWANMWRDMQSFREKAFPFLDSEYMLTEFCRGLLKAGKFSLARNYLKGTSSIALQTEKAENLVVQAAREYFFSASSLACTEIWKAKECLNLFPNSKIVQIEADIIEALTTRLPNLGVTLLPMQFKQIRNPMEIINMVISSQPGAYLNVDELIEIAKLLGLTSQEDIASVEEAIAREAAVAGDLQLAFDLCLVLARKGHGPIWDLCAAIARGPHLDNMDSSSRKQLLSFALSHCDEESIGELLHAWKDFDIHMQCENLMVSTRTSPPNFSVKGSSIMPLSAQSVQDIFDLRDNSRHVEHVTDFHGSVSDDDHFNNIKDILFKVGKELSFDEDGINWDSLLRENRKVLSFAALELPWLMELSRKEEYGKKAVQGSEILPGGHYISIRTQALISILYWLADNDIAPSDDLMASIAKSIMEPPVSTEEDVLGCSFLLNLVDAFQGVEIIEQQLKDRKGYQEMFSIMNVGMVYSSLQNSHKECATPDERRNLLIHKFQEKHTSFIFDELEHIEKAQSTFWREWKAKLEEQKHLADQARNLEQIIPGIETARFLSGDAEYIKAVVFSFIDSVKTEKNHILKEAVKLADTYGLNRNEVLLRFFGSVLVSDQWRNDDILAEISEFRETIVKCAKEVIIMISSVVYPEIDGHNKQRLSYIYGILSACYLHLRKTEEPALMELTHQYLHHKKHNLEPFQFYKVIEQECQRVSFISELDFKNIAGLDDLNFGHINEEVSINIRDSTIEALADMVRALGSIYSDSEAIVHIMSWQDVYKHHIQSCLAHLESESSVDPDELPELVGKIEANYDVCNKYIKSLEEDDQSYIIERYCKLCLPSGSPSFKNSNESAKRGCLIVLMSFWIKMADDEGFDRKHLARCLKVLKKLVTENEISTDCGWSMITGYVKLGLKGGLTADISSFFQAMIFSGCGFNFVAKVYSEAELYATSLTLDGKLKNLVDLYVYLMEKSLLDLSRGCEEHKDLHYLLASLSRLEDGDYAEDLNLIRCRVWGKLTAFSDDMQLGSHLRVYALELMQAITGQNLTNLPTEIASVVQTWEGWEQACFTPRDLTTTERADGSGSSITSTLVALKSTRLVAMISPDIKITPEDLVTLDSAVSCFLHLSEMATSLPDLNILQSVLEEWEALYSSNRTQVNKEKFTSVESSTEEFDDWSGDEWDNEGWENLPEEELGKTEEIKDDTYSTRVLHCCWMEIIRKLVGLSEFKLVIEILDRSFSKSDGVDVLLDEDEAQCLYKLVVQVDCFMALKMLLLLPYRGPWLQCLHVVEATLNDGGRSPKNASVRVDHGYELLILVLSSGVLGNIATDPTLSKVFSYLCHSVGYLTHHCQEYLHSNKDSLDQKNVQHFCKILLPCFVSQLVDLGQCLLAGFIVSQWTHTHCSLGLIDVVDAVLRKYLEGQFLITVGGESAGLGELELSGSLVYTLSRLRRKLGSMLQSAVSALPSDIQRHDFV
ncbi:MAG2-interacting protein 2 isoform X2 [Asparagus officinalis]|uniref:MAG2-interacting protein 2 isoform X2 n=1 Tax=Asparagus officinalis TaxID=4686 RepID=UPI00098E2F10|nr:MAG2-interacting protein 2 isoform X2 [Asparagus officinalis]